MERVCVVAHALLPGSLLCTYALLIEQEALTTPETAAICHLILDTCSELPSWQPRLAPHHAVGVLLRCAAEQPRLAPKVAAAFHLTVDAFSVDDQVALLDAISGLLDTSATSAAGVALLLHFGPPVQRHFHLEAVLEDLVRSGGGVGCRSCLYSRQMDGTLPGMQCINTCQLVAWYTIPSMAPLPSGAVLPGPCCYTHGATAGQQGHAGAASGRPRSHHFCHREGCVETAAGLCWLAKATARSH